jgi:prepilin-type N-terminal cleavage/methylation domain-containing protein
MGESRSDAGFTLIELLVVVGLVVVVIATLGVFFLAGPSPAVAAAARDIDAAFFEARETATAFQEATVVFSPAGDGYSARVYREMPGATTFGAGNGPTYDSTVTIAETAAPMGAPGFAFRVDSRGSVTGYEHYSPGDATFSLRSCPATGAFTLALAYGNQKRTVTIPCTLTIASETPGATTTPAPGVAPPQYVPGTCAPTQPCVAALAAFTATCPPGYTPDGTRPNVCDAPPTAAPTATPASGPTNAPTCPAGETGSYPVCSPDAPASTVPTSSSTAAQNWTWTANLAEGSHLVIGSGWAYWVAVDIQQNGTTIANNVCYGTGDGPSVAWSTVILSAQTTPQALEADGVPSNLSNQVISSCGSYRYPQANPLAGSP